MWPGQNLAEQAGPRQRLDQRVSQACPWPCAGSVPSLGSLIVPWLQFPPWVLISEPKGSLSSRLPPIRTTKSPPPTFSPRRSGAPFAHAPRIEARLLALVGAVRMRKAAQRPTRAVRQDPVRPPDPPTPSLPQRAGARARNDLPRVRTGSGRVGWRAHEAGRAAEAGVVDWVGREAGTRVAGARAACVLGGRPAEAERARAPGSPPRLAAAATASLFREVKRDAHSIPDPSWRVGGGARKATAPVPPGKERRLAGETRRPVLGEDGLNEAEAPGGGGGRRATRAGSGYGGARGSRSLARGSGRSAARSRPLPGSVAGEAGGPGPRGGRARVLVRSWDKAPSLWRSRDSDLPL